MCLIEKCIILFKLSQTKYILVIIATWMKLLSEHHFLMGNRSQMTVSRVCVLINGMQQLRETRDKVVQIELLTLSLHNLSHN